MSLWPLTTRLRQGHEELAWLNGFGLLNSSLPSLITDSSRMNFKHVGHSKKYHRVSILWLSPAIQMLEQCNLLWKEPSASQNSPGLSAVVSCLIESYRLGHKSPSAPERTELGSPGCQRRWNVKPLTCILTLCHFDKSGWRSLSADWEWRGKKFMNSQCGEAGLEKAEGEQFLRRGDSWHLCTCVPEGFINVWSFMAIRAGTPLTPDNGVDMDSDRAKDKVNEGRQNKWRRARKEQPVLVTLWYFGVQPWLRTSDWKDSLRHWRWMCQAFRGKQETLCLPRQTCRAVPLRYTGPCEKLFDWVRIQIMVTFGEVQAQNPLVRFHQMNGNLKET